MPDPPLLIPIDDHLPSSHDTQPQPSTNATQTKSSERNTQTQSSEHATSAHPSEHDTQSHPSESTPSNEIYEPKETELHSFKSSREHDQLCEDVEVLGHDHDFEEEDVDKADHTFRKHLKRWKAHLKVATAQLM